MKQYVIIGNGVAAVGCVEGIRSVDAETPITIVSEEKYPVYCRPLISYYLEGKTDLQRMQYRSETFYEDNGCTVLYGKKAEKIDAAAKTVTLDDGAVLPYTALCIAAGSSAWAPAFPGLETVENVHSFMTLDDTLGLEKQISPDSKVLIMGAGLIGLKCAEGLHGRVQSITVCDLADRVLSSILEVESAALVQKHLEKNGIRFLLSDTADHFENGCAYMKSGETVPFDVLVLAVGVRANTGLAKDAGIAVNRGILVEDDMCTSTQGVYAAGDCTEGMDISAGVKKILALLPNAYMQGKCAGENMAQGQAVFNKAIPMNAIGFFGMHIMTAGTRFSAEEGGSSITETESGYKKLFMKDGCLTGFILVDCTERAGIYTSLIREKTPLDSIDFDRLKKTATSAVFSEETRRKMFGSVV